MPIGDFHRDAKIGVENGEWEGGVEPVPLTTPSSPTHTPFSPYPSSPPPSLTLSNLSITLSFCLPPRDGPRGGGRGPVWVGAILESGIDKFAQKCVFSELTHKCIELLFEIFANASIKEEVETVASSSVFSQIVLRCIFLACIGRHDILWSVNKLARAVTQMDESF